jgi:Ca2+-binding EF-hand superfamily protein
MRKRFWAVWGVIACVTPAVAADVPPRLAPSRAGQIFAQLDQDRDGVVAPDEVPAERRQLFERLVRTADQDLDGKLNLSELASGLGDQREISESSGSPASATRRTVRRGADPMAESSSLFALLDSNGDAAIDAQEMADAERIIARLDRDGDGRITLLEVSAGRENRPSGDVVQGQRPRDLPAVLRRLKSRDTNGDGGITKEEAPKGLQKRFDKIDKNSDGVLEVSELEGQLHGMAAPSKRKAAKKQEANSEST